MPETDNHVEGSEELPCWHCEQPTRWLELAFEAPLHPGECTEAKYAELAEADRAADEAVDRAWEEAGQPRPGERRTDPSGQTFQWTGAAWRFVPRSELEAEQWRRQ